MILGGTGEAAALADQAVIRFFSRLEVIYSLAGRIKPEREISASLRVGGFGGGMGLADYIKAERINFVIDATHPFADKISASAHDACMTNMTPRLMLLRPPWDMPRDCHYLEAGDMADAARLIPGLARRVLVTTGQSDLGALASCTDAHFVIRVIERPQDLPVLDDYEFVVARPPHTLAFETDLMEEHKIDGLLTKQSGGKATVAKIAAAIDRNIPIILIRRPLAEPGESVGTVEEALLWLQGRV